MDLSIKRLLQQKTIWLWLVIGITTLLCGMFLKLTFETFFEGLSGDPELSKIDKAVILFIANFRYPAITMIAVDITSLGSTTVLSILAIFIFILALMKKDHISACHIIVGSLGAGALTELLKNLFERARPDIVPSLVDVHGFSYPSGHSLASAAIYFTLAIIAFRYFSEYKNRSILFLSSGLIVFLIGLSRIYLGVHYPSDVVAGIAIGTAWAFLLGFAFMIYSAKKDLQLHKTGSIVK